ncbi:hypothetical protein K1719_022920 [Acacia pycnantha]|nr:hypothetical protein K1719_022920 [Acacia pycnantha]
MDRGEEPLNLLSDISEYSMDLGNEPLSPLSDISEDSMDLGEEPLSPLSDISEDSIDLGNEPLSLWGNKYQVFLSSSRDEGTRKSLPVHLNSFPRKARDEESFSSCLCSSLRMAGISVLIDDENSIKRCKVSIIIFSQHYASSKRCLQELTQINEIRKLHDHIVLPIFYGVDPSEVEVHENKKYGFKQSFLGLVQKISATKEEMLRWRNALNQAAHIWGFDALDFEPSHESEVIQNIVGHVRDILDGKDPIFATEGLVAIRSQAEKVIRMLRRHKSKGVVSIGIWGMGGIGKTYIMQLICEELKYEFKRTYFFSDVRDKWKHHGSITSEATKMRKDNHNKELLLVIDDVNHVEQLHVIYGSHKWLGKGSRIIITTRDLRLLKAFRVKHVYAMRIFSYDESLQLFSRKAFEQESPEGEFIQLSRRIVEYTEGLPLALEVLGSILHGQSLRQWEDLELIKLRTDLPHQIYDKLKLSFDSLDDNEKEIFLNVLLLHTGEDLESRAWNTRFGIIRALVDQSLVTIDAHNKLRMHNLLQLMGRQISRETTQSKIHINQGHRYEVFLSFRGEDTRASFTSHLYSALCNVGINVFKDDVELPVGNYIKSELLQAIESSKISIIIFSREYAGSKWCLEELSMIMELHKLNDQVVLPVFYHVDPSEVRHQSSSFGQAFKDLIERISPTEDQVSNWRTTLTKVGSIAGIVVLGSSDENEKVTTIVQNVCDILDKKDLFVTDHPVGVDNRVQEVITMLQNNESEDVVMAGIWGMGGIGKTTIVKAIYNEIGRNFESRSYLSKIRKVWDQKKGQVRLQNQLLSEICKTTKIKINSIESGKLILKDRLPHKKALVVLDDVDKLAQLNALVGSHEWFKPGSIIIIKTRNKRLLLQKGCCVYRMKNLDENESIKLFSWHAFKQESPKEGFNELSRSIVAYSGGLPLALEVLGSYLFDCEIEEWKNVLEKLKKIPDNKIQKKLKISFDGLSDPLVKETFLDISCFFIGMDRDDVTQILNSCGFFANMGIKTLIERSLVTIDEKNKFGMHDLLRDMGREIIREQSPNMLGERSRLWFHDDALVVLSEHMGTEVIEGLSLNLSQSGKIHFETEAFKMMKRLRLLHLEDVQLKGDYKYISRDLRWLCWHGFPLTYIPNNFYQEKLVAIDLKYSCLKQVWKEPRLLEMLKILNLSYSSYLVRTPDFSKLPNLEKLILKDCRSLSKIHDSIEFLDKLLLLDLENCIGFQSLPKSIYRLRCLKILILSGCVNIQKLEEDIVQMESLTTLIAPTVKQVPFSLMRLKSILHLSICGHEGLSRHVIPSLIRSWMSPTKSPLPLSLTHVGMPSSILGKMLNSTRGLPSTIPRSESKQENLLLDEGLEISDSFCATNCMDILRLEDCLAHRFIQIGKNTEVFHRLSEIVSQRLNLRNYSDHWILPGDNYPYWLTFKGEGASVKFEVPPIIGCDHLKGMAICCVYFPSGDLHNQACESCIIGLMIVNYTKKTMLYKEEDKLASLEEVERKEIISNLEYDDEVEVRAVIRNGFTLKKMGVYLIYNELFDEQMQPSTSGTKQE